MTDLMKRLRAKKGLTQADLARRLGLSQATIAQIETGTRVKQAHATVATSALLSAVARLSDTQVSELLRTGDGAATVRKALAALDSLRRDADIDPATARCPPARR
jgi:transcriptional regulator with XRE-family HTH domain